VAFAAPENVGAATSILNDSGGTTKHVKEEGGTMLKTSLDHTEEAALQPALAGVQAASLA
jgi:hypothetical protein